MGNKKNKTEKKSTLLILELKEENTRGTCKYEGKTNLPLTEVDELKEDSLSAHGVSLVCSSGTDFVVEIASKKKVQHEGEVDKWSECVS